MAEKSGQNEPYHILDEFVCDAIPNVALPMTETRSRGQNEPMRLLEEFVHDCSGDLPPKPTEPEA
jgi:hypothetical protein